MEASAVCHPVVREAQGLRICTRREFQAFRRRWGELFAECGLGEIVGAVARYTHALQDDPDEEERLKGVIEELILGFGLSLMEAVSKDCPHTLADSDHKASHAPGISATYSQP